MKQTCKFGKKAFAVILCIAMLLPTFIIAASAAFDIDKALLYPDRSNVTEMKTYRVTNGVTEGFLVLNNKEATNQVECHILEIDLNNPDVSILAGYADGDTDEWVRTTVTKQAAAYEERFGINVVGGINADFFNINTGEPSGLLIMNGVKHHNGSGTYFAILKDGTAAIRSGSDNIGDVKEAVGGSTILVKNGVVCAPDVHTGTTNHPRAAVGIKADGSVVFFVADGRQAPETCGMPLERELAATMLSLGCVDALALDGGGSAALSGERECLSSFMVRSKPSYAGIERAVASSLLVYTNAKATNVFDHVSFTEAEFEVHPYHMVKLDFVGCDINGYKVDLPDGKLVAEDSSLGTVTGKTFMASGKTGSTKVNYVVDGEILGSVDVVVSYDAPNFIEQLVAAVYQAIMNVKNLMQTFIEKVEEKTGISLG